MKKQFVLLLIIYIQFNFASEYQCLFTPPSGWLQVPSKELPKDIKILVKAPNLNTLPPSLNLTTEEFSDSISDYLVHVKELHKSKGYSDWKDLGTVKTEAGQAHLTLFEVPTEWGKAKLMQVFLKKDNLMFVLTATSLEKDFPKFYQDFFKSIRSLNILKGDS